MLKGTIIGTTVLIQVVLLMSFACGPKPPGMPLLDAIDQDNADVVQDHMDFGTDPNKTFIPPGIPFAGASALHLAALKDNREIAKILLDNGADIDIRAQDTFQGTPLEWAAFFGIRDMAVFLVESGADLNAKNAFGTTPLDATASDNTFVSKEDLEEFKKNRAFIREYLSTSGGKSGLPAVSLLDAIDQDNADVVRDHMELGTDPDKTFIPTGIPFAGASALHLAVLKDNREIARILLDNGADINIRARDAFQGTPLEWAAFFGIRDMAVFLVESGADLNARNAFGTTPLDATVSDNTFIPQNDLEEFSENRAFIREYLSARGGKSGQ